MTPDEIKKVTAALIEQAKEQVKLNSGLDGYLEGLKKISALRDTILANAKIEKALHDKMQAAELAGDIKLAKEERAKIKILKLQTVEFEKQLKIQVEQVKQVKVGNQLFAKTAVVIGKSFAKLPDLIQNSFGKLKSYGLFEMSKSIKTSALSMGILSKQSDSFRDGLEAAALSTTQIGVSVDQLAKMQADYSDELGRTVILTKSGNEAMGAMAAASGLGAEGTSKMAADMENQGYSAERTAEFVEQVMNDSHKMGLNSSKVVKNIQQNMKMLNKYNFKGGAKGLEKMAELTTKLGVDMAFAAPMADKLFDVEGAVEMSAQLQVMGGEWAKMSDPFKLMNMARNDMAGLTEALGKAAESSAHFNSANGAFEISAMEMQRLRKIAEQTGVSYEDLATAGKNAAKFTKIKTQLNFSVGGGKEGKELQEYLTSKGQFNDKGEATINIKGDTRLIKTLTEADKAVLRAEVNETQTLKKRAESARTFDESLTNTVNMFKTAMLPLINTLNDKMIPQVDKLVTWFKKSGTMDAVINVAKDIGKAVAWFGEKIATWPKTFIGLFAGAKIAGFLFGKAEWLSNGMMLSKGFDIGQKGGTLLSGIKSMMSGGLAQVGGKMTKGGGAMGGGMLAGGLGIGGMAVGALTDATTDPGSAMNILGNAAADAMTGAALGAFLGPIGMAVGAGVGGLFGGIKAYMSKPETQPQSAMPTTNPSINDGVINSINKPIHDGISGLDNFKKGLGSDFNKGRGIIQGGQITPIDNKDDLIASKPNGPINSAMKSNMPSSMKIEFGDIHFSFDELRVTSPRSPGVAVDLLKDPQFLRNITKMVHVETSKAINGGKLSPSPR